MIDELNQAIETYNTKWQALIKTRKDKAFFEGLKPTTVGWKTTDRDEYGRLVVELHDRADRIIETWMNGRWIAKLHLRDTKLAGGVEIIKIMQRRPGSTDTIGLDHLDFYTSEFARAEQVLKAEPGLKWTWESNDIIEGYDWLSVWFDGTEAKIKGDTVLDIVTAELTNLSQKIIGKDA